MDHQMVVIRLELQLADDSLTGRASDGTGTSREFAGWMGLVAAIDALVRGNSPATAPDSSRAGDEGAAS